MSLEDSLASLKAHSKKLLSVQLNEGATQVTLDLISRKRKLIRVPEPHEIKLTALYAGDPVIARIRQEIPSLSDVSSTKREDIERILKAANSLNQICNFTELQSKIEELAHVHEERQTNIDYLYESTKENELEISELKSKEAMAMDVDTDLDEERVLVERYSRELRQKRAQREKILKKKRDQLEVKGVLREIQQSQRASLFNAANQETQLLEQQIFEEKQRIQDLESNIEAIDQDESDVSHAHSSSTTRELNNGLKTRIDKLLHSANQEPVTADMNELVQLLESVQGQIRDHLEHLNQVESKERHDNAAKQVYLKLLDFVRDHDRNQKIDTADLDSFHTLFPANTASDTSFLTITQEAQLSTVLLSKLYNSQDKSLALSDLTKYIQDYAKDHGCSEQGAVQTIYKLVGLDLVIIDRSQNDSIVKLL